MNYSEIYISVRKDRYGANSIPWILAMFISEYSNKPLYHNCSKDCDRFKDTIIHNILLKKSNITNNSNIIKNDIMTIDNSNKWPIPRILKRLNWISDISFPDRFYNSNLYKEVWNYYDNKYSDIFNKTYKHIENSTIIYVRLEDNGPTTNFKIGGGGQGFTGIENLIKLIKWAYDKFNNNIYIVGAVFDNDKKLCNKILEECSNYLNITEYNKYILNNTDMDYDVYLMMKCKNLIIGKSTFAFIPSLLHQNVVYAEEFRHLTELTNNNCKKITSLKI